jgi:hypothetical protein
MSGHLNMGLILRGIMRMKELNVRSPDESGLLNVGLILRSN